MNTKRIQTLSGFVAATLILTMVAMAHAEIVFADLGDLPLRDELVLSNPPFAATFLIGPPCEELPPGIWGPPCIAIYDSWFGDSDGSAGRFAAGDYIGTHVPFVDETILAGFEIVNPDDDPADWFWRPIVNDWLDRTGAPVRGYIAWHGTGAAGDPHYGWIELTVEYDPAAMDFDVVVHGYAFETEPGVGIVAGDTGDSGTPCPGDLDGDSDVDLSDLAALLANYGTAAGMSYEDGDLDGDGDVDLSDLATLLAVYNTRCE